MPVEDDEENSQKRNTEACGELPVERLSCRQKTGHYGSQHGRRREEQPNVGSHAVFEGIVFRQEIKGTAKDPRSREQQFLTKSSGRMTVRIRGEEDEVGEHMPVKHDFLRAKAVQEDFGGNERRTPYRDDGDGDDITADLALHGRPIRDCIVARYAAACRKEPSCAARHRVAYKPMKVARAFIINLLPFQYHMVDKAKPRMVF